MGTYGRQIHAPGRPETLRDMLHLAVSRTQVGPGKLPDQPVRQVEFPGLPLAGRYRPVRDRLAALETPLYRRTAIRLGFISPSRMAVATQPPRFGCPSLAMMFST